MSSAVRTLVLVRHGQSTDNEQNLFSGFRNPDLTERGVEEAKAAGRKLKDLGFRFDIAFTSKLDRAQRTLTLMLEQLDQSDLPIRADSA
ncbi:MAG: 2,3-bisphosphoglycerate-dependent phosphoglycerate mutase, partial [Oxalobacteraceae bacterium]